ncbi:choline transporter-like protein 4 [Aplochiton taeniatus]
MFYVDILKCTQTKKVSATSLSGIQCPTTQVCVKKCPSTFWMLPALAYDAGATPKDFFQQQYCDPSLILTSTTLTVQEIIDQELCPHFYVPSTAALGRCLPILSDLKNIPGTFTLAGTASVAETVTKIRSAMGFLISTFHTKAMGVRIFEDFASSWYWILLGLLVAMFVSLVFMLLLRYMAFVVIWVLIAGFLLIGGFGIYYCYMEYKHLSTSSQTIGDLTYNAHISAYLQVKETWLAFVIIMCIVEFIMLAILAYIRRRLAFAVALIEESSKVIGYMMSTLVYPMFSFILLVVCVAYWGITSLFLATSGAPVYRAVSFSNAASPSCSLFDMPCYPETFDATAYPTCPSIRCIFFKYDNTGLIQKNIVVLQIFNVFVFLWLVNFVIALGQCSLAGAFSSYYWAFNKHFDIPRLPLAKAFFCTLRYHVGSLALGSLLLTLFQLPRLILEYLYHKFHDSKNPFGRFMWICLRSCFFCLELFMQFISRNAFINIAIYGESFCLAGRNAFNLKRRNMRRAVVLSYATDVLLFCGKLLVIGANGVLAFYFFSGRITLPDGTFQAEMLNYYWAPIITVVVGSYLIAQGFFSVYSMCVDTLFLCFLEDLERNDGSVQRPYYMSRNLMRILQRSQQK